MSGFQLQRLGMMMEPEPGNPQEIEGVLNPAAARGPDGKLYLFPAAGRQGQLFAHRHRPRAVQRSRRSVRSRAARHRAGAGSRLRAAAQRRRRLRGSAHTFVEPLQHYVMTYTALSPSGPRIALAISEDLFHWKRLGLATFEPYQGIDFVHVDNKDASSSPSPFPITPGRCSWPCSTGRFFPAPVPRKPPARPSPGGGSRS
jgi:beta-1,2-mannobiose phosphorylase / 1,2-beta-oligomannan phosphorylase